MLREAAKIALAGTDRADFSAAAVAKAEADGIDIDADSTQILLEIAALYTQKAKAGRVLQIYSEELPPPADDADEYVCSDDSAYHLRQILEGKFRFALPEFIRHLTRSKKQLPPEMLPDIIENRLHAGDSWDTLRKIIGKRGIWLMRRNPEWHKLLPLDDPALWADGNPAERLSVLRHLRRTYPELAAEMLQTSWPRETARHKVSFLEILADNLTTGDEPFLEKCLDEKSAEVRKTAAALLSALPDSRLTRRTAARARELLTYSAGKMIVKLPESSDSAGLRDGLFAPLKIPQQGLRAAWAAQIIAYLPPRHWEEEFGLKPLEILEKFFATDYARLLLYAVLTAVKRYENAAWAEAYLRLSIEKHLDFRPEGEVISRLLDMISDQQFNQLLGKYIKQYDLTLNDSPLQPFMRHAGHSLTADNTVAVIDSYKKMIAEGRNAYGNYSEQKEILRQLAYTADFNVAEQLKKGWDINSRIWRVWAEETEKFFRVLQFRKIMTEGLSV